MSAGIDLARVFGPGEEQSAQVERFVVTVLQPIVQRVLRRLPQSRIEADDLVQEIVVKVLEGSARLPRDEAGLQNFVKQRLLDMVRKDLGRMRCSGCASYGKPTAGARGVCLRNHTRDGGAHPHFRAALPPHAEPRLLRPPCTDFQDARRVVALPEDLDPAARSTVPAGGVVGEALARLASQDAVAATLVAGAKIDGLSYAALADQCQMTVHQVKHGIQAGLVKLQQLLGGES